NTIRISCSMSRSSLMPASSRPIAALIPRSSKKLSGARPLRRRKLELQLWQTWVPVAAMRSRSASLRQTPCPNVSRGPRNPKRSIDIVERGATAAPAGILLLIGGLDEVHVHRRIVSLRIVGEHRQSGVRAPMEVG